VSDASHIDLGKQFVDRISNRFAVLKLVLGQILQATQLGGFFWREVRPDVDAVHGLSKPVAGLTLAATLVNAA
jgi:hypothetical protein